MTSLNTQLWELISTHKMPDDASGKPFTEQLMAEHRISRDTANVAISEYIKFMYLCATRSERNVPSQAVDLVWHLHMQHSRDYWDRFCQKLGKPVHHNPGGQSAQHLEDYKSTVEAYQSLFGTPPKGIWKQNSKEETVFALFLSGIFILIGLNGLTGAPLFAILWLIIPTTIFVTSLNGLTQKGEFTLVFESSDPFANDDAGDCGSGDCGGCGD